MTKPNQMNAAEITPFLHGDGAEMADHAGQHPGHDQVGDERDDERPRRRALAVMGADLLGA